MSSWSPPRSFRSAWRVRTPSLGAPYVALLLFGLAAVLGWVYASRLPVGLWEDGYFGKRFAHNFLRHGSFSWNVSDGPVYGMTSQTLQLVGTLVYAVAPHHYVVNLKSVCTAAAFLTLPVLWYWVSRQRLAGVEQREQRALLPWVVGLSVVPVLELMLPGLESTLTLPFVALSLLSIVRPELRRRDALWIALGVLGLYLTRPDAVLIPLAILGGLWLLELVPGRRAPPLTRRWSRALPLTLAGLGSVLGLGLLLAAFHAYYGTALPLPFYLKVRGLTLQPDEYVSIFDHEKQDNALRMLLISAPFVFIALHARCRQVLLPLGAALLFCGYHYVATIEIMGYFSRFYLPALVPLLAAAGLAFPLYQARRRWWLSVLFYAMYWAAFGWLDHMDNALGSYIVRNANGYLPLLAASGVLLLGPAQLNPLNAVLVVACLLGGLPRLYPLSSLEIEDDDSILLRQIAPRAVFRGLPRLHRKLQPKTIFHTDMGAPGALFLESRVVDLDGLLNEDITLHGKHFEQLCQADQPEAIFVPNESYVRLREEVLASECLKNYVPVVPMDNAPLHIRKDVLKRY